VPQMNCAGQRFGKRVHQNWQRYLLVSVLLCLAHSTLSALAQPAQQGIDGGGLFKAKCAVCHAADGGGNTAVGKGLKLRDLRSAEVQSQTDAQLGTITTCGKGKMPAYEIKLSDEQIHALVSYMRKLAKNK
jgi:mono/diheme cytochrome c family protein